MSVGASSCHRGTLNSRRRTVDKVMSSQPGSFFRRTSSNHVTAGRQSRRSGLQALYRSQAGGTRFADQHKRQRCERCSSITR